MSQIDVQCGVREEVLSISCQWTRVLVKLVKLVETLPSDDMFSDKQLDFGHLKALSEFIYCEKGPSRR
jgi:hypothetical protein